MTILLPPAHAAKRDHGLGIEEWRHNWLAATYLSVYGDM
jgi:hypothetical protein